MLYPRTLPLLLATAALLPLAATASPQTTAKAAQQTAAQAAAKPAATPASGKAAAAPVKRVDINSAGKAELMTLPGIGEAEAGKIIAGRPYLSKARLAADKIVTMSTYEGLKGRIVAVQKEQPAAKSKTTKPAKG